MGSARTLAGTLAMTVAVERFPIAGRFAISRGARTEAVVVTVTIADGGAVGRGECVPYARFVDLDGPLLLARDRDDGLRYEGSLVHPPSPALWG